MPPQQRRQVAGDGPTLGEIGRLLETLREEQKDFRKEVNDRFDGLAETYVRRDVFEAVMAARNEYVEGLVSRVAKLEGNQAWIVRIIITAVITAGLGALFAIRGAVGG